MDFRKVSDNELRCIMTIDEMREKGMEFGDLMKRNEKTTDFFEDIMSEASDEVGFEPDGPMTVEGTFVGGKLELTF